MKSRLIGVRGCNGRSGEKHAKLSLMVTSSAPLEQRAQPAQRDLLPGESKEDFAGNTVTYHRKRDRRIKKGQ